MKKLLASVLMSVTTMFGIRAQIFSDTTYLEGSKGKLFTII